MRVKVFLKGGWNKDRQVRSEAWPNRCDMFMKRAPQSYWGAVSAFGSNREESLSLKESMVLILLERLMS